MKPESQRKLKKDASAISGEEKDPGNSAAYFAGMLEHIPEALIGVDDQYHIIGWNVAAERIYGWLAQEAMGQDLDALLQTEYPDGGAREQAARQTRETGRWNGEVIQLHKDGTRIPIHSSVSVVKNAEGRPIGFIGINRDISVQKQAEKKLAQMKRLYATLSQVNQTIVHVREHGELYRSICNVAVQFGEFSLAWIGLLDEDSGEIRPVAANGLKVDQWPFPLANIRSGQYQNGLIATALRTSKVVTSEDLQTDERTTSLHNAIQDHGYHSSAAVPFHLRGKAIGVLGLVSPEAGLFKAEEEIRLLDEMSLDISFALDTLETEAERQQAEKKIERQNQRLLILREIDVAILAADSVESIVTAALGHIRELIGCRRANLTMIDWETNESVVFDVSTVTETAIPKGRRFPLALYQDVIQTLLQNKTLLMDNLSLLEDPRPAVQSLIKDGLQSLASLPIYSRGQLIGMFSVYSETPGFFDEERIDLVREVANQVAIAITQSRLIEGLRESEQKYSTLFHKSAIPSIMAKFPEGTCTDVNEALEKTLGYNREEVIGKTVPELGLVAAEPRKRMLAEFQQRGSLQAYELEIFTKSGEARTALLNINTVEFSGQKYSITTMQDITERKQVEKQLAQMKRLYATLSQVNQTIVRVRERDELYQSICDVAVQFGDFSIAWIGLLEDATGDVQPVAANGLDVKNWPFQIVNIHQGALKDGLIATALRTSKVMTSEDIQTDDRMKSLQDMARAHGFRSSATVPFRLNGRTIGVLNLVSHEAGLFNAVEEINLLNEMGGDISFALDTMENEKLMRQWADAFEHCAHGIVIGDPVTNRIITCNPAFARAQGGTIQELSSMPLVDMYAPQDHERIKQWISQSDQTGSVQFEARKVRKDGSTYDVQMDLVSVRDENGNLLYRVATQQDITERIQADKALRASEEKFRQIAETIDEVFWISDPEISQMLYISPAYERIWGRTQNSMYTEPRSFIEAIHPEDRDRVIFDLSLQKTGKPLNHEYRIIRPDGSIRWVWDRGYPIVDDAGRVSTYAGVAQDITERKQAEQEIRQRTEDLQLINTLNDAANRGEDMDAITQMFVRETRSIFACQDVAIYLLSPDSKYVEMQNTTVSRELYESIEKLTGQSIPKIRIPLSEGGFFWELLSREEGVLTSDPRDIERWIAEFAETIFLPKALRPVLKKFAPQILKILNIRSVITVPLVSSGRMIGLMDMSSRGMLTDEDHQRIRTISRQVTAVLLRKQAEEQVQLQVRRLSALAEIDRAISSSLDMRVSLNILLSEVLSPLNVDAASVLLLNNSTLTLEYVAGRGFRTPAIRQSRLQLGEGLAGQVGLERKTIHIRDLPAMGSKFKRADLLKQEEFVEYFGVPLMAKGTLKGVLEIFHRTPLSPDPEWLKYLETLGGQAAIAIDNAQLFEGMQKSNLELVASYDATIAGWSHAMDLRDKETEGHTQRVTDLTMRLGERMGISAEEMIHIRRGALLHDIGKLGVPDHILLKPGPLTDEEWDIMRQHPAYAYNMLAPIVYLRPALDIPYCHHEKWDGSGYPRGLKGDQIPLSARIFSIVDVWDALRSDRPYRARWSVEKTRQYLLEQSGRHFDPRVVEAFLRVIESEV